MRAKVPTSLKPAEVSRLPRAVALDWLDGRAATLLGGKRIGYAIETIRAAAGSDFEALDERVGTAAVLARLMYRAGQWDAAASLIRRHLRDVRSHELALSDEGESQGRGGDGAGRGEALLSLTRTLATILGKGGGTQEDQSRVRTDFVPHVKDPLAFIDIAAHLVLRTFAVALHHPQFADDKLLEGVS